MTDQEMNNVTSILAENRQLREENERLKAWKQSEIQIWRPIIEYMQLNGHLFGMKLGESISDKVLEVLKANSLKL